MTSHLKAPYSHSVVNESSVYLILQGCRIFPRLEIPKNRLAAPPSLSPLPPAARHAQCSSPRTLARSPSRLPRGHSGVEDDRQTLHLQAVPVLGCPCEQSLFSGFFVFFNSFFSCGYICGALLCGSRERPPLCAEAYAARRESGGGGSLPASATASAAAPHSRLHALPAAHFGFVCYGGAAAAAHR